MLNLTHAQAEALGAMITEEVDTKVREAIGGLILARSARICTSAVIGITPFRNYTSPNGDTITNGEAAVWLSGENTAADYVWCPIVRGLTVSAGDYVWVMRDSLTSNVWRVTHRL